MKSQSNNIQEVVIYNFYENRGSFTTEIGGSNQTPPTTIAFLQNKITIFIKKSNSFINKQKNYCSFLLNNIFFSLKKLYISYKIGIPNIPKWVYLIYLKNNFNEVLF